MNIAQVMKRTVYTCTESDKLDSVARTMWNHECGCVPVVDGARKVVGMITDRDICLAALQSGLPLHAIQASQAMTRDVKSCRAGDTIERAEELMRLHQVRRLPVVDSAGVLEGILTLDDLARAAMRTDELVARPVTTRDVGRTLGSISRPHLVVDVDAERS
jgi:CBS domain-containing protein